MCHAFPSLNPSVADPHHSEAGPDPDPTFHFDADPDSVCLFDADPDSTFLFDSDPDPIFQCDVRSMRIRIRIHNTVESSFFTTSAALCVT